MIRAWLFLFWLLVTSSIYSQRITVIQINAQWNDRNSITLRHIKGAEVSFGYLEEQPESLKEQIKAVPSVLVFKDGKLMKYWKADLSFKLNLKEEEVQKYIDSIK